MTDQPVLKWRFNWKCSKDRGPITIDNLTLYGARIPSNFSFTPTAWKLINENPKLRGSTLDLLRSALQRKKMADARRSKKKSRAIDRPDERLAARILEAAVVAALRYIAKLSKVDFAGRLQPLHVKKTQQLFKNRRAAVEVFRPIMTFKHQVSVFSIETMEDILNFLVEMNSAPDDSVVIECVDPIAMVDLVAALAKLGWATPAEIARAAIKTLSPLCEVTNPGRQPGANEDVVVALAQIWKRNKRRPGRSTRRSDGEIGLFERFVRQVAQIVGREAGSVGTGERVVRRALRRTRQKARIN